MNERNWDLLLDAIKEQRVVLVLGDNLFTVCHNGIKQGVSRFIIDALNEKFAGQEKCNDLTEINELICDYNFINRRKGAGTNIYYEINQLLKQVEVTCPESLKKIVQRNVFPLLITTSYIPGIGELLGVKAEDIGVYKRSAVSDIDTSILSCETPTLYHLFGKSSNMAKSFVVTEDDLLDYIHCLHDSKTKPNEIGEYLSDKYLLVLGCDYPNWLFRFFWYYIRNVESISYVNDDILGLVSVDKSSDDRDLYRFLQRIQANVCEDAEKFLDDLNERLSEVAKEDLQGRSDSAMTLDFFVSYASEDLRKAEYIVDVLNKYGANDIWFDKKKLKVCDEYDKKIKRNILKAQRFIALISRSTLKKERRYFRTEWSYALEESRYRLNMDYIVPIIIDDCDLYSELIPETFQRIHCLNINDPTFENNIKELIRDIRR